MAARTRENERKKAKEMAIIVWLEKERRGRERESEWRRSKSRCWVTESFRPTFLHHRERERERAYSSARALKT